MLAPRGRGRGAPYTGGSVLPSHNAGSDWSPGWTRPYRRSANTHSTPSCAPCTPRWDRLLPSPPAWKLRFKTTPQNVMKLIHMIKTLYSRIRVKNPSSWPAMATPPSTLSSAWASHTHFSQHSPGTCTLRGNGQSGPGSMTSRLQRGTQLICPRWHTHW